MDTATEVQSVMRGLTSKPPALVGIRGDIAGIEDERVREALDAVNAMSQGNGAVRDPYSAFLRTLKKPGATRRTRANSAVLRGLERMRD